MNRPRPKRAGQHRKAQAMRAVPVDIWRTPDPLPDVEPIAVAGEPGALLRSLGDPPMNDRTAAGHYFNAVVERAAAVAAALALSADLLVPPED